MGLSIHNTLTRSKEEFKPLSGKTVNFYTCGVTVYDDSHIGHARSLYIFDVMRRYLKYRGFDVRFVRNITDIDDKIINRSNELGVDWRGLVDKYIASYRQDLAGLGISEADVEPRATENILEMIGYIRRLIEKGYAYEAGGDVYFEVRKFPAYGKLSGQGIDEMRAGSRIEPSSLKRDTLDFALWKSSKEGEPFWDSPWGKGRPGWHIECSVMSQKFLKTDTLDIHAGGRDLVFPHHENEIAQAEAATGKPFARYWIHNGLLTINGQKMSKSLGNFVTIKDFIAKYKNVDLLKIFFLSAHYSHPIDFTEEKIREAEQALERITILLDKIPEKKSMVLNSDRVLGIKARFLEAMDDDFNTPQAWASIFELANAMNKNIDSTDFLSQGMTLLIELGGILGLQFDKVSNKGLSEEEQVLVNKRIAAKRQHNFAEADRIRKELETRGVVLEDSRDGKTTWRRKL